MTKQTEPLSTVEKGALALKNAGQVLMVYAFFLTLPWCVVMTVNRGKTDQVGWTIFAVVCLLIILLVVAGILILKRRRSGIVLWWIVSPLLLLAFPIGTAAGVYVITCILKPEAKEAMKVYAQPSPPPIPRAPQTGHSEGEG